MLPNYATSSPPPACPGDLQHLLQPQPGPVNRPNQQLAVETAAQTQSLAEVHGPGAALLRGVRIPPKLFFLSPHQQCGAGRSVRLGRSRCSGSSWPTENTSGALMPAALLCPLWEGLLAGGWAGMDCGVFADHGLIISTVSVPECPLGHQHCVGSPVEWPGLHDHP